GFRPATPSREGGQMRLGDRSELPSSGAGLAGLPSGRGASPADRDLLLPRLGAVVLGEPSPFNPSLGRAGRLDGVLRRAPRSACVARGAALRGSQRVASHGGRAGTCRSARTPPGSAGGAPRDWPAECLECDGAARPTS